LYLKVVVVVVMVVVVVFEYLLGVPKKVSVGIPPFAEALPSFASHFR
jgi:hypothetical protein